MPVKTLSRRRLAKFIRQLAENTLSGAVIIQTEANRAIMLRFSSGKLVRVNARGNSAEDAIAVLKQSTEYKVSFSPMEVDSGSELLPLTEFLGRLAQDSEDTTEITFSEMLLGGGDSVVADHSRDFNRNILRPMLVQLASVEIGPIATIVVDQAINDGSSIEEIINVIAKQIPSLDAASTFTAHALERAKESLYENGY